MNRRDFIRLVEGSQKSLRRFLASLCSGDADMADDIAQETYLKAFMMIRTLDKIENFNAWIMKIGYNTFLNWIRSKKISVPLEELRGIEAEDSVDKYYRYENLYQALDGLPSSEKSALVLYYLEGFATKEIAGILDTSDESVRQSLSRGRKRLKKLLKD